MTFSDYLENAILNHVFRNVTISSPDNHVGLTTGSISDTTTGSTVKLIEPSTSYAYARRDYSGGWTYSHPSIDNDDVIQFNQATGSWGTVTNFFIADANYTTGGNILLHGVLTNSKLIESGDQAKFNAGNLIVSLD